MAIAPPARSSRLVAPAGRRPPSAATLLAVAAATIALVGVVVTLLTHPLMVDLEIPLRAADRWAHGGEPYLASAFQVAEGSDGLPFLYPPAVLPLLAPLAELPRVVVQVPWVLATIGAAIFALRRLGVPRRAVPLALCWVPFAEGLVGGNAQVLLVAAFVAVFFDAPAGDWRPVPRDPRTSPWPVRDGVFAVLAPALKVSQPHGLLALGRRRPVAALWGVVLAAAVALATLPLVGVGAWQAWLDQLGRAADPGWALRGSSLVQLVPGPLSAVLTALSAIAVLFAPPRRLGAAAGLLLVLGAPSLRTYGALFLLPAMLEIRREAALAAICLIGLGTAPTLWAGIAIVTIAFLGGSRIPALAGPDLQVAETV